MIRSMSKGSKAFVAATLGLALTASACGGDDDDADTAATTSAAGTSAAATSAAATSADATSAAAGETSAAAGETSAAAAPEATADPCEPLKAFGDIKGKTVSLYTSVVAPEDVPHINSYKVFEECTGAKIKYEGSKEFETQIVVRAKAGNPPDIGYLPQPGLLKTLVDGGYIKPAPAETAANVDKWFDPSWKEYGSVGGTFYAAPLAANVKSFVWYSPKVFKEKGYAVPQTFDEMIALSDKIAADDPESKPWCAGFESGVATGWPGTDWLEDMMLRVGGPEAYDAWQKHETPFNDQKVVDSLAKAAQILKNEKYANGGYGGVDTIGTTRFQDGGLPIVTGGCYLHRQASFYAANFPEGTKIAEDGDVFAFYFPAIDPAAAKPVLGGGEFVAAFADRPEVKAFQTYLSSDTWANEKGKASPKGGFVSANKGLDVANVASPVDKLSVQILQDPKAVFRFDASDLMPTAVNAAFWKGMTDWVSRGKDDKATLDDIEKSWPQ